MPWTKTNYPASMKNLQVGVRHKAIEIANAILKQNKKMDEGILIATAIKNAKKLTVKSEKKTAPVKKSKPAVAAKKSAVKKTKTVGIAKKSSVKKTKPVVAAKKSPVKKTKTAVAAKKQVSSKKVVKKIAVKRTKAPIKKTTKVAAVKKRIIPVKKVSKPLATKKIATPATANTKSTIKEETPIIIPPEIKMDGEDLHLIPEQEHVHPLTTMEVHQKENIFHHHGEVVFHEENLKVKAAKASRKNNKITYQMKGRR